MKRRRSRHCQVCGEKFYTDARQKNRQRCCSRRSCQNSRHSRNVRDWYLNNPDCLEYQRAQTRVWFKDHPRYQRAYRKTHPVVLIQNRRTTKARMRRLRSGKVFEKMNSSFLEVLGNKSDKCFLNARSGWMHLRLKKQTRYTEYGRLCHALGHLPRIVRPFTQAMFDLGQIAEEKKPPP